MEEVTYCYQEFNDRNAGARQMVEYLEELQIRPRDVISAVVNPINGSALLIYADQEEYAERRQRLEEVSEVEPASGRRFGLKRK